MENAPPTASPVPADPGPEIDLTGKTIGDFQVLRRLGSGGMGQVYLAEQLSLKRNVALKILRADLAANPTFLKRFQAEAEAVARVTHANIVQVYSIGHAEGLHFMALEYVDGRNLRDYIARKGPPEIRLAVSIMRQVASALQRASELGIVHRDIKPENILLARKGEVKVTDFGLSRCFGGNQPSPHLTQSGVAMGTPLYMSPEQVQGKEADPRSDIYSFGVTCYHMLVGQPPYTGQSAYEVAIQHVQKEPVPLQEVRPDLPSDLCTVVQKMMVKEPAQRYQTGREVLKDLALLHGEMLGGAGSRPVLSPASPTGLRPMPQPPSRNLGRAAAVLLTVLLALAGGAGIRWWQQPAVSPAPPPPAKPRSEPAVSYHSIQQREKTLREALQKGSNPKDARERKQHLDQAIELGMIYLQKRKFEDGEVRLEEAEKFFTALTARPPQDGRVYGALGRIGLAMVQAFEDDAEESCKLFLEAEKVKPPPDSRLSPAQLQLDYPEYYLLQLPQVRRMAAEALTHNAANLAPKPLPEPLEKFRKLPSPTPRPG